MQSEDSKSRLYVTAEFGILIIVLIIYVLSTLFRTPAAWGINLLKFYPTVFSIGVVLVFILLIIPQVSRFLSRAMDYLTSKISRTKFSAIVFILAFSAGALILFYFFRAATTFLGDGQLRLNEVAIGKTALPKEFLDFQIHSVLFHRFLLPYGLEPRISYQIISILSGIIFIIGIFRLARLIQPQSWLSSFLVLLSSGITVLFFGYIESYSIIAALLPFVFLAGLKSIKNPQKSKWFIFIYILAGLVHSIAFILFLPALLLIGLRLKNSRKEKMRDYLRVLLLGLGTGIVIIYICRYLDLFGLERNILALIPTQNSPQAILTWRHFTNLINWPFLSALPVFVLVPGILAASKFSSRAEPRVQYGIWTILPAAAFMFFFTPQLGGPRDWDLFSIPAFLILMGGLTIFSSAHSRNLPSSIIPLAFLSIMMTLAFAGINHSVVKSADRFAEIIEVQKFRDLYIEYNLLSGYAGDHPELAHRRLEFTLKSWEEGPHSKKDSVVTLNKLMSAYTKLGNSSEAMNYYHKSKATDSLSLVTYHYLMEYYRRWGNRSDLRQLAATIEKVFQGNARGQMDAGTLYMDLGEIEKGAACLDKAYKLDSNDVFVIVNYGVFKLHSGDFPNAIRLLTKAVQKNPEYFAANFNLGLAYAGTGDGTRAVEYFSRAEKLASTQAESAQIIDIKNKFRKH